MKPPRFFDGVPDLFLRTPRRTDDRLKTGTLAALKSGARFTFGSKRQSAPASIVLAGTGEALTVRLKAGEPTGIRFFLFPSPTSTWNMNIIADEGAEADIACIIAGKSESTSFTRFVSVGKGASIALTTVFLQSGTSVVREKAAVRGEGGSFRSETLAVLSGNDAMDALQDVRHEAPRTITDLVNSLVASDAASIGFDVTGAIAKGNAGANCRQQNRGVILGDGAAITVSPKLLIDEFDVQAGHGCAIGRVNADELYYLSSRGLDPATAKRLIVSGYTAPFLAAFSGPESGKLVERALAQKLGGVD